MAQVLVRRESMEPKPEHPACPGGGQGPGSYRLIILTEPAPQV